MSIRGRLIAWVLCAGACGAAPPPAPAPAPASPAAAPAPVAPSTASPTPSPTVALRCIERCDEAVPLPAVSVRAGSPLAIELEVPSSTPWIQRYATEGDGGGRVYFTEYTRLHPCTATPAAPCTIAMHEVEPGYFDRIEVTVSDVPAGTRALAIDLRYGYCNKANCLFPSQIRADVVLP